MTEEEKQDFENKFPFIATVNLDQFEEQVHLNVRRPSEFMNTDSKMVFDLTYRDFQRSKQKSITPNTVSNQAANVYKKRTKGLFS